MPTSWQLRRPLPNAHNSDSLLCIMSEIDFNSENNSKDNGVRSTETNQSTALLAQPIAAAHTLEADSCDDQVKEYEAPSVMTMYSDSNAKSSHKSSGVSAIDLTKAAAYSDAAPVALENVGIVTAKVSSGLDNESIPALPAHLLDSNSPLQNQLKSSLVGLSYKPNAVVTESGVAPQVHLNVNNGVPDDVIDCKQPQSNNLAGREIMNKYDIDEDDYKCSNRETKVLPRAVNKASHNDNSTNDSIGTWQSDKPKEDDSDSDMEIWTKPTAISKAVSSAIMASKRTNSQFPQTNHSTQNYAVPIPAAVVPSPLTASLYPPTKFALSTNHASVPSMYQYNPNSLPLSIPETHIPTWDHILPSNFFAPHHLGGYNGGIPTYRKIILSLINFWEFTLEGEVSRIQIKKIAKGHIGKDGRNGAVFERVGILPDDPVLKGSSIDNTNNNTLGGRNDQYYRSEGKWRIPLGAYQPLLTYLSSVTNTIVEGIPSEQLRAATLGRERFQKGYPSAEDLVKRGVAESVARALAPYQRGGVDFILEKEGRALLADEMGLGKTVQAIAAMSAYWKQWPLLILTPSSARYHWEMEVRQWLNHPDCKDDFKKAHAISDGNWDGRRLDAPLSRDGTTRTDPLILNKESINVVTSGRSYILRADGATKVVIVSYGLIVALINSEKIRPGMFQAIIVDESHALKNKASKRTIAVMPLLKAADRCLLLSGTPALARPSELWPQISVLGGRREGLWIDEMGFYSKYVRGELGDENASKARLAELHTLLTSTVMIRRMKVDMLKNLQSKIREKAYIDIRDENLKNEFRSYMQMLRQGRGIMGKFAREHSSTLSIESQTRQYQATPEEVEVNSREALHHLYKITGKAKIGKVSSMLIRWLNDPTLGKLCIFAHHLDILDEIARISGLSNCEGSAAKYIRIDGSTLPKTRQEHISSFQTDPTIRVALLGITAAGVAVTLTASSTVWFAELFWTPAIMIQAEDRCHRIGQQARVRCLYFIARGTLDEILWKLIEKKFRDLGEFVEGRENMDIALERELEEEDDDEILKVEENVGSNKRKLQDDMCDLFDMDDAGIKQEINDLVHEEEDMLKNKNEEEEDEVDGEEKTTKTFLADSRDPSTTQAAVTSSSNTPVISLLDEDEKEETSMSIQEMRDLLKINGVLRDIKLDHTIRFTKIVVYKMQFRGQRYGFNMLYLKGRAIVKEPLESRTKVGSIVVAIGSHVLGREPFATIMQRMKNEITTNAYATLTFADDSEFIDLLKQDILPRLARNQIHNESQGDGVHQPQPFPPSQPAETINLLDDE